MNLDSIVLSEHLDKYAETGKEYTPNGKHSVDKTSVDKKSYDDGPW